MTAVRGCFADFKTVKTRGVCQLIIEVPIESADHALAVLGGVPQAKAEQWVGIAPVTAPDGRTAEDKMIDRMVQKYAPELRVESGDEQTELERPKGGARAKRAWNELSMPEQAGILVNDVAFAKWLLSTEYEGYDKTVVQDDAKWMKEADAVLKSRCGIESKSELGVQANGIVNSYARGQFIRIEREWRSAQRGETPEALAEQARMG